jgi:hypothetical protein
MKAWNKKRYTIALEISVDSGVDSGVDEIKQV